MTLRRVPEPTEEETVQTSAMAAEQAAEIRAPAEPSPQAAGRGPRPSAMFSSANYRKLPRDTVTITSKVGDGSFGNVYADESKTIAVKLHDDVHWAMLESAAIARLYGCPFIVPLLATNVRRGAIFMPLANTTLRDHQMIMTMEGARGNRPMLAKVKAWAWQMTTAMAHAHRQGVVHRDIKPSNVLVKPDGSLWLADWSNASFVSNAAEEGRYQELSYDHECCTVTTRPPETLGNDPWSHLAKGDVWSLGVTIAMLVRSDRDMDYFWTSSADTAFDSQTVVMAKIACLLGVPESLGWGEGFSKVKTRPERRKAVLRILRKTEEVVTANLLDLLTDMLHPDPDQRPSSEDCLRHPFFRKCTDVWSTRVARLYAREQEGQQEPEPVEPYRIRAVRRQNPGIRSMFENKRPQASARDNERRANLVRERAVALGIDVGEAFALADCMSRFLPGRYEDDAEDSRDIRLTTMFMEYYGFDVGIEILSCAISVRV